MSGREETKGHAVTAPGLEAALPRMKKPIGIGIQQRYHRD